MPGVRGAASALRGHEAGAAPLVVLDAALLANQVLIERGPGAIEAAGAPTAVVVHRRHQVGHCRRRSIVALERLFIDVALVERGDVRVAIAREVVRAAQVALDPVEDVADPRVVRVAERVGVAVLESVRGAAEVVAVAVEVQVDAAPKHQEGLHRDGGLGVDVVARPERRLELGQDELSARGQGGRVPLLAVVALLTQAVFGLARRIVVQRGQRRQVERIGAAQVVGANTDDEPGAPCVRGAGRQIEGQVREDAFGGLVAGWSLPSAGPAAGGQGGEGRPLMTAGRERGLDLKRGRRARAPHNERSDHDMEPAQLRPHEAPFGWVRRQAGSERIRSVSPESDTQLQRRRSRRLGRQGSTAPDCNRRATLMAPLAAVEPAGRDRRGRAGNVVARLQCAGAGCS
jgi:hypothetical protein